MFSAPPQQDLGPAGNIEQAFQTELVVPAQAREAQIMVFVNKFWPTATPTQVLIGLGVVGLVLSKIAAGPQNSIEEGLAILARKLTQWGKPKRRRGR